MSADQLRTAAERLRALAEAVSTRDDAEPWEYNHETGRVTSDIKSGWDTMSIAVVSDHCLHVESNKTDGHHRVTGFVNPDRRHGEFIAAMDPNVAMMLADWLEATAMEWSRISKRDVPMPKKALALAEYINGRTQ